MNHRLSTLLILLTTTATAQHVTDPRASVVDVSARTHTVQTTKDTLLAAIPHDDISLVRQNTPGEQFADDNCNDLAPFTFFAARFPKQPLAAAITSSSSQPTTSPRNGGNTKLFAGK